MLTPEQEEIARTVGKLFKDRSAARRASEGGEGIDRALWAQFAELGLIGVALPEELGGSGLGLAEEAVVVELASGFVAPLPFVSTYAAAHVLAQGSGEATAELAGQLAAGDRGVGVALSAETSAPQGLVVHADGAGAGRLVGAIEDVFEGGSLDVLLVPVDGAWWAVDVRGEGVEFGEIGTLDPTRRQARVVFEQAP
ncbi:MAG: acyl-CoA dehydrogenase, partial [Phenylobacterium sp.]|nr:acyl-CoA dehydrogenase [Phenylobacterium sp.]